MCVLKHSRCFSYKVLAVGGLLILSSRSPSQQPDEESKQTRSQAVRLLASCSVKPTRHSRVGAGVLENLQHAGAGDVPHLGAELLAVQDHQVFKAVGSGPSQLFIIWTTDTHVRTHPNLLFITDCCHDNKTDGQRQTLKLCFNS